MDSVPLSPCLLVPLSLCAAMTFTRPLLLLLLPILPLLAYLGWPKSRYARGRAWAALILRCLIALLIILGLAGIQSVRGADQLAVVFLVDASDSVPQPERQRALDFVGQALAALPPDDQAALVLFGADALVERPMMGTLTGPLDEIASIPRTHHTNLETAIRLGTALFPAGAARRLVILSDGRPTLGQAEQAVRLAHAQGVQIDVVPLLPSLAGQAPGGVEAWLTELDTPARLHQGEEFTLSITARATADTQAALTILSGETVLAQQQVRLNPGPNTFAIPLTAGEPGFNPIRAYLTPAADTYPQNNTLSAFTLIQGPPRILLLSPPSQEETGSGPLLPPPSEGGAGGGSIFPPPSEGAGGGWVAPLATKEGSRSGALLSPLSQGGAGGGFLLPPPSEGGAGGGWVAPLATKEGSGGGALLSPPSQGGAGGGYIRLALQAAGLDVAESTPAALPSDTAGLAQYAAVVLIDTPAQTFSPRALSALQSYVRDLGGGLVAVGGPHAYGVGGWYDTPLEQTLPVWMIVRDPQRFPPMSIVVVIDKSGSMAAWEDGVQKIRLAGEAAARVAELLTDLDEITVIAFDDRPADVIGPLPADRRQDVIDQVIRLQAGGGGIYVRESLQEALHVLAESDKAVRHIVLLADGSDAEHQRDVPELVEREIVAQNITLSTVAIGAGNDLPFLEYIAELGGGRYHYTDQAANLPVIFAQETQLAMRSYVVEEPFYPRQTAASPILTGIDALPQLAGYVATTPKPAGRVILATHQNDPLLAAWQYGLGRAVAWTSDATARWAQRWVTWDGFTRFWAQAVRWTIVERADVPVEVDVTLEGEQAHVTMDAVDQSGAFVDGLEARLSVVGPEGEPMRVELAQTAPGRYEGTFVPPAEGAYLMRLTAAPPEREGPEKPPETLALTTGWVMGYSPEYAALEGDPAYLERLAELGGGAVLENPQEALAHDLRGIGVRRDLWPILLGLAALLLPFDVGVRRLALGRRDLERAGAWISAHLPRRRPRPVPETPTPLRRLLRAKSRAEKPTPEAGAPPPAEPPPPPAPPFQPKPSPLEPPPTEGETLAERLLRRKREREEDD